MKIIKAVIEKGSDGNYSIYTPEIAGLFGTGETEQEAKKNLKEAIEIAVDHVEETTEIEDYAQLLGKHTIEYTYDLSGFFKTYHFFDIAAFAQKMGMNASLMRHYKTGMKKASTTQKSKIFDGIYAIANELNAVRF